VKPKNLGFLQPFSTALNNTMYNIRCKTTICNYLAFDKNLTVSQLSLTETYDIKIQDVQLPQR